jgi:hypothetical protein
VGEPSGDMGGGGPVGGESLVEMNPDCTILAVVSIS